MKFKGIFRWLLVIFIFLLPWKFGSPIGNGEMPNFPLGILQWIFFDGYPAYLAAWAAAAFLLLNLCGGGRMGILQVKPDDQEKIRLPQSLSATCWQPILWGGFFVFSLVGLIRTTEIDQARLWLIQFAGLFCWALVLWRELPKDEKLVVYLRNVLCVVGMIGAIHGWWQHFGGLREILENSVEQMAADNMQMSEQILARMQQLRVYGCFVDPNVYASFLLLTLPFSLATFYLLGRRFEYPKLGVWLGEGFVAILYGGALFWSGSRGAAVGLAAAMALGVMWLPQVRGSRWRWILPIGGGVLAVGLIGVMCMGVARGGMASASVRLVYYQSAWKMFLMHPWTGVGLGEFFPWHMKLMPMGAEVTRNAHSLFFSALCQMGCWGGIVVILLELLPWAATICEGKREENGEKILWKMAGLAACAGWLVHSLFQFNELVPGTLYLLPVAWIAMGEKGDGKAVVTGKLNQAKGSDCAGGKRVKRDALLQRCMLAARVGMIVFSLLLFAYISRRMPGEIILARGEALDYLKCPGEAKECYLKALEELPPGALAPLHLLQSRAVKSGNWAEAEMYARLLIGAAPHRASHWRKLAEAERGQGKDNSRSLGIAKDWGGEKGRK